MEDPIIVLSDDEEEIHGTQPRRKPLKKQQQKPPKEPESEFPVKSKKKPTSTSFKNPTKQVFTWFLCKKFDNHEQAAEYILGEKVWSRWYNSSTESGAKQYYRCNRVKYSAKQCSARIYTRFSPESPDVFLFSNNLQHDHDRSQDPSPHHKTIQTSAQVVGRLPLPLRQHQNQQEQVPNNFKKTNQKGLKEDVDVEDEIRMAYNVDDDDDDDDEFDEDFGDEDEEDSYFIDTSLLRVEIEEEPDTFISADGSNSFLDESLNSSERDTSRDDDEEDIMILNEDEPNSPSMKIAKVESHFNVNQFVMDIPKQKFTRMNWHPMRKFASGDEARNYIHQEKTWSKWYFSHTETGAKQYYRCNKAKYSGRQCAARVYLLYQNNSDEVHLMGNGNEHDHDSSEFKATYSSLTDGLKRIIQKCCELKQKPKDIITKLESLNLPLPSRYHLRKYILELQEKM